MQNAPTRSSNMGTSQTKQKRSTPTETIVQGLKNKVRSLEHELDETIRTRDSERQTYERELVAFAFRRKRLKAIKNEEERERRRDQTVEKWKQLYFAVKLELDHLIQRTHQEAEKGEEALVELRNEVRGKEDLVGILRSKVAALEQRESKREREMDILRQSLRIMSHSKKGTNAIKLGRRSCR